MTGAGRGKVEIQKRINPRRSPSYPRGEVAVPDPCEGKELGETLQVAGRELEELSGTLPPRISIDALDVWYGQVQATDNLTFDVAPGEFVSVIGPSGCGKTSALRAAGGLIAPTGGAVRLDGTLVTGPMPNRIAFLFQDLALFPWRSALRNVELGLEFVGGVGRKERRERAMQALRTVGLADAGDRFPGQLSGGMKQRVALARAFVSDADVLLFDEPFAAVDEHARMILGVEVLRLLEEHGKTVLFVTHSLSEAAYLSDRIVVTTSRPGRVLQVIDVDLERPRHPAMMKTPEFHALTDQLFQLLFPKNGAFPASKE